MFFKIFILLKEVMTNNIDITELCFVKYLKMRKHLSKIQINLFLLYFIPCYFTD